MTRIVLIACSLFSFSIGIAAQTAPQISLNDVQVLNAAIGAPSQGANAQIPITVTVKNVGSRAISAFDVGLNLTYADGTQGQSRVAIDLIGPIISNRLPNVIPQPGMSFNVGETRNETRLVNPSATGATVTQVNATVAAIVYVNRMAVGNERTIHGFLSSREDRAKDLAALLKNVQAAQAAADPNSAFQQLIAQYEADGQSGGVRSFGLEIAKAKDYYRDVTSPTLFANDIRYDQMMIALLHTHSMRVISGGAQ